MRHYSKRRDEMPRDEANKAVELRSVRRKAAGRHVKARILSKGMSIKQFAKTANIDSDGPLSRIINGRKRIDLDFAELFANMLGNNIDYWLTLEDKIADVDAELLNEIHEPADSFGQNEDNIMETEPEKSPVGTNSIARAPKISIVFREATLEFEQGADPAYLRTVADAFGLTLIPKS